MENGRIHTPDGVRDIYGGECTKKTALQSVINKVFYLYGYQNIETPTFEFFTTYDDASGSVKSGEMFKFFDRDNHTLVLKPDETPAIARCVAKYFIDDELPIRLCYLERTFNNNYNYRGRLKEATQTGAELIGDASPDADAEMIAMVIRSLMESGLTEFQVELGQVEFFKGLLEEAGMDGETEEQLRLLIENKNYLGVEELVMAQAVSAELKQVFLKLPKLFGSLEQIQSIRTLTKNKRALKAVSRLKQVHDILKLYGLSEYVSYDLGMLSQYQYYTGIIFKAYSYGTGDYIVNGGRYDKLLNQFGKDEPAVGFAISVDELMLALSRQQIDVPVSMVNTMILYEEASRQSAIRLANHLRSMGMPLQLVRRIPGRSVVEYQSNALHCRLRNMLYLDEKALMVQVTNVINGSTDEIPLSEYLKEES